MFISAAHLDPLPPFTCSYSAVLFFFLPLQQQQQQLWEKAELNKSSQPYQFSTGSCHDWTPVALPGKLCVSVDVCGGSALDVCSHTWLQSACDQVHACMRVCLCVCRGSSVDMIVCDQDSRRGRFVFSL